MFDALAARQAAERAGVLAEARLEAYLGTALLGRDAAPLPPLDETCCVCLDSGADGRVTLPCRHAVHAACLRPWVRRKGATVCPVCHGSFG